MRCVSATVLLSAAAILTIGCSSEPTSTPPGEMAIALAPTASGDGQSGTVGAVLGGNLRVLVTRDGLPASGVSVNWAAGAGSGTVAPAVATTDGAGIALAIWTMPTTSGSMSATATLSGAEGSPVAFTAQATAGPATSFELLAGDDQVVAPGGTTDEPLTVVLRDTYGNGVTGSTVSWTVYSGTATLSESSVPTGAGGTASVYVTAGASPGPVVVRAIPSETLPEVDFNVTVTP